MSLSGRVKAERIRLQTPQRRKKTAISSLAAWPKGKAFVKPV